MKKKQLYNFLRLILVLTAALVLSGCGKVVLYSNLSEKEVNEMTAILLSKGIDAVKIHGTIENEWSVEVSNQQIAQAIDILNAYGYPHATYDSLGKVFQKSGLVSSPSEERIRFMYALSQGLAETISQIDGVLTARVHVVLQNNDPFSDFKTPSSASVFIKYRRGSGVENLASQIKRLVANSIEGLNYDKISLVYVPSDLNQEAVPIELPPVQELDMRLWLITGLIALLILIVIVTGGGYWYLQYRNRKALEDKKTESEEHVPSLQ